MYHQQRRSLRGRGEQRPAFTLVEILLVLLVLGLLTGAAVARLTPMLRRAALADVQQRIEHLDQLARAHARQSGIGTKIVHDQDRSIAFYVDTDSEVDGPSLVRHGAIELGGCRIAEVRSTRSDQTTRGTATVECSTAGYTRTYALRLAAEGQQDRWLVFAGLTGIAEVVDDPREFEATWATLAGGHDAR
jgi:prepilin-type N-terminal cleavage/methylation domain-containing protein